LQQERADYLASFIVAALLIQRLKSSPRYDAPLREGGLMQEWTDAVTPSGQHDDIIVDHRRRDRCTAEHRIDESAQLHKLRRETQLL
jgi:hypothetical protein